MKRKKISALLTAAILSVSLLPVNVSAYDYGYDAGYSYGNEDPGNYDTGNDQAGAPEEPGVSEQPEVPMDENLSGKIRIKGTEETGETLSVDFTEMQPAWVTEDCLDFTWYRTDESNVRDDNYNDDLMTEVGYSDEYNVEDTDAGQIIVVKVEAVPGRGLTGKLYAKTGVIKGGAPEDEMTGFEMDEAEYMENDTMNGADMNPDMPQVDSMPDDSDWSMDAPGDDWDSMDEWAGSDETPQIPEGVEETITPDEEWNTDDTWVNQETVLSTENVEDDGWADLDQEVSPAPESNEDDGWADPVQETSEDDDDGWADEPEMPEELLEPAEEENPSYTVDCERVAPFELVEGYTEGNTFTITVANDGNVDLNLGITCTTDNGAAPSIQVVDTANNPISAIPLAVGQTASFSVVVPEGLPADTEETGSIVLNDTSQSTPLDKTLTYALEVIAPAPAPKEDVSVLVDDAPDTLADFGTWTYGSESGKGQKTVTVENTGNIPVTVSQVNTASYTWFNVSMFNSTGTTSVYLEPGAKDTLVISPAYNSVKPSDTQYEELLPLKASGDLGDLDYNLKMSVKVAHSAKEFIQAINPADIGSLPNGISKKDLNSVLPVKVDIMVKQDGETIKEETAAVVNWNVDGCDYDPSNPNEQIFVVPGSVTLPGDVVNPASNPQTVQVKVSVAKAIPQDDVVTEVFQPASLTNLPNGISVADIIARLPKVIQVRTSQSGVINLAVAWDANMKYNPSSAAAQEFYVYGTYALPKGVKDPKNLTQGGSTRAYVSVVAAPKNNLIEIIDPSPLVNQPNGISKKALAAKIPTTVQINTSINGIISANVKWNYKNCPYDPASDKPQTFVVPGTVVLPNGVYNPNNIPLSTSITINVLGRTAKIADESANTVTGLDTKNGYLVGTPISFTAIGAGMDNNAPQAGDVRYVPASWKITNTYEWTQAPYTGQFKITQPGNYSLAVTYRREVFNGSAWQPDGQVSKKNFSFRVYAAGPAATLTPAVTQKPSVATGDTTPIGMWIAILAIAAACIAGGIVLYIKKRK